MAEAIEIRPFEIDDLPEVLELLRVSLGEPAGLARTPDLFAWKHLDNPFGRSVMLVASAGDRIAGFRAFMRWELSLDSGVGPNLRCVRPVDTATHPDFQRRGIFRNLTMAALDVARDDGVDLVFNTPNEASRPGYLTMGWSEVGPVGVMVRPRAALMWRRNDEDAWVASAASAGSRQSALAQAVTSLQVPPGRGLRTPKTSAYLNWRYDAHPTARYAISAVGSSAAVARFNVRNGRRELVVSELAGTNSRQALRPLLRSNPPDYAVAWFSPSHTGRRLALRAGLIPIPRVTALTLVANPLRDLPFDATSPDSWTLGLGDLELL